LDMKSCLHLIVMVVILFAMPLSSMAYGDKPSHEEKIRIWKYYTQFEDIYGVGKAVALTTKKFGINGALLESIKAEGRTKNWPLPSQERERDYYSEASDASESGRVETELYNSVELTEPDRIDGRMAVELLNKELEIRL
jgi:hypothetical protein